ncbi:MAG: ABC transporter substrate-binding protein [Acidimicrobiia bacterium]|nr:ABC transporter substrate-binding protein [Acidimicrobiia bacterium]
MEISARVIVGLALAVGLALPACGGDDPGESAASVPPTSTPSSSSATTGAAGASSTTSSSAGRSGDQPTSMQEWEALWDEERAAAVDRIEQNGWGTSADGTRAVGPEGFVIDLGACPEGWSDTEGLTDSSIKVGYVLAQSGPAAAGGGLARAEDALFQHYASTGGYVDSEGKARTVEMVVRDDAYDAARTIPLVDELIDSEKVFLVQTSGTPPTLRTYDKLNQRCIPQPLTGSGHSGMGDPVNHPWTTNAGFSYGTEAIIWAAFIEQRLDEFGGKAKVAFLKINNEGGAAWEAAFEAYIDQSDHRDDIDYVFESHEPTAATITEQMTTLAAFDPDFFFVASTGTPCSQVLTEAAQNGMKESVKYKFLASTCKATGSVTEEQAGDTSDGWWSAGGGGKDLASPAFDGDPWVEAARGWLSDAGHDYEEPIMSLGMSYAWTLHQGLMIGGALPGGLTRSNLMIALRTMDMTNPNLMPGIRFNMNGNADAFLLEGSEIARWSVDDQAWIVDEVIDLSGRTSNCAWDTSAGACG